MKLTKNSLRSIIAKEIKQLNEQEENTEAREDAFSGGENLENPIDHAKIASDISNVDGVESLDPRTGEVTTVNESFIRSIIKKVNWEIKQRSRRN